MTRKVAYLGVMAALSIVLVLLIRIPLFPTADFLEYDPADIPILITTFVVGPGGGLLLTVVVSVIQGLTVSAKSGLYGILMHVIATGSYVLVAGLIYRRFPCRKGAGVALISGGLAMTAVMLGANLIITPLFTGWPVSAIQPMLLPVFMPFNLLKAFINAVPTFLLYNTATQFYHQKTKGALTN
ncbi:MAG TPA: ECF transporter S component [Clostridiales bacterium]|nr:ECF transporter S component [Clostridiales bacterium]